jgi:hypothetical protein
MRSIRAKLTETKAKPKQQGYDIYCTVNGVLSPVVYTRTEIDGSSYIDNVNLTKSKRVRRQISAKNTRSTLIPVTEGASTINAIASFTYDYGLKESSGNISYWLSSYDRINLEQSTTANQPDLGLYGKGVLEHSPIYFKRDNSDFMSLDSAITVSGDFTMFFYIEPIPVASLHKQYRLLGKSDDNDMYISIGESINESYNISFASGSEYATTVSGYWQPSSKRLLITIQREGSKVYIRENGTQVATGTIPTSDFVFDQFGKIGNVSIPTFNGSLYHFSLYDGYISNELQSIENSIIKKASLAKG